jgi:hypothetical protein
MADKDKTPDPAKPPTAPIVTIESLQAENAALKQQIAELTAKRAQNEAEEKIIGEKMAKGLTRAQAISVIARQKAYDESELGQARAERVAKANPKKS